MSKEHWRKIIRLHIDPEVRDRLGRLQEKLGVSPCGICRRIVRHALENPIEVDYQHYALHVARRPRPWIALYLKLSEYERLFEMAKGLGLEAYPYMRYLISEVSEAMERELGNPVGASA